MQNIRLATAADIPELKALINSAFRGETAKKGWTHEADLLEGGIRTDEKILAEILAKPDNFVFVHVAENGEINGCVNLQIKERGIYLGMLTVAPEQQGAGIGKQFLAVAESFASEKKAPGIFMTVVSARAELIAWYERHGYALTGETRPFEFDERFGLQLQPLQFVVLEKLLA